MRRTPLDKFRRESPTRSATSGSDSRGRRSPNTRSNSSSLRLYHRPASAKGGQHIASESTLTPLHIAAYGLPDDGLDAQFYAAANDASLGDRAVAALQSSGAAGGDRTALHASSVAATLAIAQLDAQRPVALLRGGPKLKDTANLSHFERLHRSFAGGSDDAWVRIDTATGYLWREVRDPDVMKREAAFYRRLADDGAPTGHLIRVLGNDRRYVAIADGLRAPRPMSSTAAAGSAAKLLRPASAAASRNNATTPTASLIHHHHQSGNRSTATNDAAHWMLEPEPGSMYRSLLFVVTEPYRCTLRQAIDVSKHQCAVSGGGGEPPLAAADALRFLRDTLEQLQSLHMHGVTHNMIHPELICIAPQLAQDFDRVTRFARSASQLAASRKSRNGSSVIGSETGSVMSYAVSQSSKGAASERESMSAIISSAAASHGGGKPLHGTIAPVKAGDRPPMLADLAACCGKLMDLSAATVYVSSDVKKLEVFTLTAQRRNPDESSFRVLPLLSSKAMDFATPPEWTISIRVPKGPRRGLLQLDTLFQAAMRKQQQQQSAGAPAVPTRVAAGVADGVRPTFVASNDAAPQPAASDSDTGGGGPGGFDFDDEETELVTRRIETILPEPSSDVYLFGKTVEDVFRGIVEAEAAAEEPPHHPLPLARGFSSESLLGQQQLRESAATGGGLKEALLRDVRQVFSHVDWIGLPECAHFVAQSTQVIPSRRLTIEQCLAHPFFWTAPIAASFVTALAEFFSVPRVVSAADTLAFAARGKGALGGSPSAKQTRPGPTVTKSPADLAGCSKDLLRWASVVITSTSAEIGLTGATTTAAASSSLMLSGSSSSPLALRPGESPALGAPAGVSAGAAAAALASGIDNSVAWLNQVNDWYEAVCHENVAGVRYDYENTVRDQLTFFSNVYAHVKSHGTPGVCDGDENAFAIQFLHSRFPGSLMRWLKRLAKLPSDGDKFVAFVISKGRVEVPHSGSVLCCVQRFVAEQRAENAEKARQAEVAKAKMANLSRRPANMRR